LGMGEIHMMAGRVSGKLNESWAETSAGQNYVQDRGPQRTEVWHYEYVF
jgi:hypothetical protein